MNYKLNVDSKKKVFHAKLLKLYIARDDSEPKDVGGVDAAASEAIIESDDEDGAVDDKGLLDLLNVRDI